MRSGANVAYAWWYAQPLRWDGTWNRALRCGGGGGSAGKAVNEFAELVH
jgi:hypothetical protein